MTSVDTLPVHCEHADRCAGCPLIELPYDGQLARKRGRVVEALVGYPALELVYVEPPVAADPITGYRTRAKLVVAPRDDQGIRIGIFASGGGHVVLDTPACRVLSPAIAEVASVVRSMASEPGSVLSRPRAPALGRSAQSLLRALDVREAIVAGPASVSSRLLVTFVASRDDVRAPELLDDLRAAARELCARLPAVAGVALNLREGDSPQVLGSELHVLAGDAQVIDQIGGVSHVATFGAFVQAHRGQAHKIHEMLISELGIRPGSNILDLYGGSGAIGLALAKRGAHVRLVESFAPAAKLAVDGARILESGSDGAVSDDGAVGRLEAITGEVSEVLAKLQRGAAHPEFRAFDAIVVNPPRRGVAPLVRQQIAQLRPAAIAYVSCDPETFARDLDHFARLGYSTSRVQPVDMIPLTDEVETVAILRPAPAPVPRLAYSDDEVLIVEKSPHEPTTPQGEYTVSLLHRVRRLPDAENAVPVHRLDVGTSGLVIFARRASQVSAWAEALGAPTARKIYLAGARGRTPSKGAITRELRDEGRVVAARTRYRWLGAAGGHSVLRVVPEQGRTHQIRRHLAAVGHPVLGDDRYGHAPTNRFFEEKHALDRTFLHCVRLELDHPRTGVRLIVETPVPGDLRLTLTRCGGPNVLRFLHGKAALGGATPSTLPPFTESIGPGPESIRGEDSPFRSILPGDDLRQSRMGAEPLELDAGSMSIRPPITTNDDD